MFFQYCQLRNATALGALKLFCPLFVTFFSLVTELGFLPCMEFIFVNYQCIALTYEQCAYLFSESSNEFTSMFTFTPCIPGVLWRN